MIPASEQMEKATQGMMQMCEEMNAMARESMDVAMKSVTAMTKGCDETLRSTGGLMQETMNRAMSVGKTMMSAKSMQDMMNMHAEFVKECFDCAMAASGKMSEISSRVSKEAIEPVMQHTNAAMSKMMKKTSVAA